MVQFSGLIIPKTDLIFRYAVIRDTVPEARVSTDRVGSTSRYPACRVNLWGCESSWDLLPRIRSPARALPSHQLFQRWGSRSPLTVASPGYIAWCGCGCAPFYRNEHCLSRSGNLHAKMHRRGMVVLPKPLPGSRSYQDYFVCVRILCYRFFANSSLAAVSPHILP